MVGGMRCDAGAGVQAASSGQVARCGRARLRLGCSSSSSNDDNDDDEVSWVVVLCEGRAGSGRRREGRVYVNQVRAWGWMCGRAWAT